MSKRFWPGYIAALCLAVVAGFCLGRYAPQNAQSKPSLQYVPLALGETLTLSTNGFEDGKHYHKELRIHKIIGKDGAAQVDGSEGNEQRQTWTIQQNVGTEEQVAVVLIAR